MNTTILLHSKYCDISNKIIKGINNNNVTNKDIIHICIDNTEIRNKILYSELKIDKVPCIIFIEND